MNLMLMLSWAVQCGAVRQQSSPWSAVASAGDRHARLGRGAIPSRSCSRALQGAVEEGCLAL